MNRFTFRQVLVENFLIYAPYAGIASKKIGPAMANPIFPAISGKRTKMDRIPAQ
jgi:hypothetical protein